MMIRMSHPTWRWMFVSAAALGLGWASLPKHTIAAEGTDKQVVQGNTLPYGNKPTALGFQGPGFIKTVNVKEGDRVKVGQVLMTQDSTKENLEYQGLLDDTTDVAVRAAEAESEAQKAARDLAAKLFGENAGNTLELAKAEADYKESLMQIEKEKQDQQIKILKAKKQEQVVKDMTLVSPVDGFVQSVDFQVGENVDPTKPVLTIVRNDPLIVEMLLSKEVAQKIALGRSMNVSYDQQKWVPAKVTFKEPMANLAGDIQKVHLELSNAEGRDSGQTIYMELPADLSVTPVAADVNVQAQTAAAGGK